MENAAAKYPSRGTIKYKLALFIIICYALMPVSFNLFLFPIDTFIVLTILFASFPLFIISMIVLAFLKVPIKEKIFIPAAAILVIAVSVHFGYYTNTIGRNLYFSLNKTALEKVRAELESNSKITGIANGRNYWIVLNKSIVRREEGVPEDKIKHEVKLMIEREGVDPQAYYSISDQLYALNFLLYVKYDSHMEFTTHSMTPLGCAGIAYSLSATKPEGGHCGEYTIWLPISDNWYYWVS